MLDVCAFGVATLYKVSVILYFTGAKFLKASAKGSKGSIAITERQLAFAMIELYTN